MDDVDILTKEIDSLKALNQSLQDKVDSLSLQLELKEAMATSGETQSLTEIILENSSAILFRRLAAVDPKKRKLVYVSPNIARFGYRADDFLQGNIMFRDIVFPGDSERTLKEISDFVTHGIGEYSQTYRIVTKSGDVRWIKDHTSIYFEESTGLRYHQGIVIDIHEQKQALLLAAEVQRSLLPEASPDVKGLDIAGRTISCDEVGGDYYDYLPDSSIRKGSLAVIIGDIMGHGVDAALLMASARAFLRMRASQAGSLEEIVAALNQHLTGDMEKTGRFMTLFYLSIDRDKNRIDWVRAGHDPALLYDPARETFEELKGPGLALGVNETYRYQQQCYDQLALNQVLVLATDGIYEAGDQDGAMFGKERLKKIIQQNAAENAETILSAIMLEHTNFTSCTTPEDDITLVIVKIVPQLNCKLL